MFNVLHDKIVPENLFGGPMLSTSKVQRLQRDIREMQVSHVRTRFKNTDRGQILLSSSQLLSSVLS